MLEIAHTDKAVFPHTELYNEGWMLRTLLYAQSEGTDCLPFASQPKARWFSEALIDSPFLARESGDELAEGPTSLDGVVGHFSFRPETKTGLTLTADARQLVVIEAKMYNPLSKGVTRASYYDQAARTVACIAWMIGQSDRSVGDLESLAFYVFAPEEQITRGVFKTKMRSSSIRAKVERRIKAYSKDTKKHDELQTWYNDFFTPTLERIDLRCESWESMVKKADDNAISGFYARCREFNRRDSKARQKGN